MPYELRITTTIPILFLAKAQRRKLAIRTNYQLPKRPTIHYPLSTTNFPLASCCL